MKFFLMSDNVDTLIGMRLAGVEGIVVHDRQEFIEQFERVCGDKNVAILLITEELCSLARDCVDRQKQSSKLPLVVEIPDRHGSRRPDDYILGYVKDAIGVQL